MSIHIVIDLNLFFLEESKSGRSHSSRQSKRLQAAVQPMSGLEGSRIFTAEMQKKIRAGSS